MLLAVNVVVKDPRGKELLPETTAAELVCPVVGDAVVNINIPTGVVSNDTIEAVELDSEDDIAGPKVARLVNGAVENKAVVEVVKLGCTAGSPNVLVLLMNCLIALVFITFVPLNASVDDAEGLVCTLVILRYCVVG